MKFLLCLFAIAVASCCPFSLFSDTRPGAEPDVDQLCKPILAKEAPGLSLDGHLKVDGDWAFFIGDTMNDAGETVTPHEGGSSDSVVLFKRVDGKWQVVEHGIGITDAYYFGWVDSHGVPKDLLMP